jgi:hypothetical protein
MKKYEFTYIIKQMDLETGHIIIEYIPVNKSITKISYNVPTFGVNEDTKELKTLNETICDYAPHNLWEAQELLLEHGDSLLNSKGTIDPNA